MINPTDADIGRRVIYRNGTPGYHEVGTITSFNPRYVFVRYHGQTSMATRAEDLEWEHPGVEGPAQP